MLLYAESDKLVTSGSVPEESRRNVSLIFSESTPIWVVGIDVAGTSVSVVDKVVDDDDALSFPCDRFAGRALILGANRFLFLSKRDKRLFYIKAALTNTY